MVNRLSFIELHERGKEDGKLRLAAAHVTGYGAEVTSKGGYTWISTLAGQVFEIQETVEDLDFLLRFGGRASKRNGEGEEG